MCIGSVKHILEDRSKLWNITGTWKEIWTQKGEMEGTKEDIRIYDGWEKSTADMEIAAKKITKLLNIKPTDKVLEVGCGAGGLAQYMNCEYIDIDFSSTLVKCVWNFTKRQPFIQRLMIFHLRISTLINVFPGEYSYTFQLGIIQKRL